MEEQKKLLKIVQTWNLNETPEFRGFRCANCQEYKNEAWYHWLDFGGYKLPVHMCDEKCEKQFKSGRIIINPAKKIEVDRDSFGIKFRPKTINRFREIVDSWRQKEPELKPFSCDECGNKLEIDTNDGKRKGFHVWWKIPNDKTLTELHFHKHCGNRLGIK